MRKILSLAVIAIIAIAPIADASCQTLDFQTESLPLFLQGESYNFQIVATGGTPGYTFSLWSGSMPAGLHLTSAGYIEGEPDGDPSDTTIFVRVTDSLGCQKTQAYAIRVEIP